MLTELNQTGKPGPPGMAPAHQRPQALPAARRGLHAARDQEAAPAHKEVLRAGPSYRDYERYLSEVIDELLAPLPAVRKRVNLLGVVPEQQIFWKGTLLAMKSLLEEIGLTVNTIFAEGNTMLALREIPAAELNLVFSHWVGVGAATRLEERFGTPFTVIPAVPVGPRDTSAFLRFLARRLRLRRKSVEQYIAMQEKWAYGFAEFTAGLTARSLPRARVAVVADAGTAVGLVRYGCNDLGWLPQLVVVNDDPPAERHADLVGSLTFGLAHAVQPTVRFETDPLRIKELLCGERLQLVLSSSLEKAFVTEELDAVQVSVAYPGNDRLWGHRSYAGYRGGLALMEDVATQHAVHETRKDRDLT